MNSPFTEVTRGKLFKPGDVIVHEWYRQFCLEDNNPDLVAITILGDIVAWYRNGTGASDKFGEDAPSFQNDSLYLCYNYFERKFGFKEDRARRALARLHEHSVLTRDFKNISCKGGKRVNKLVIKLNIDFFASCFDDPELDIRAKHRQEKREASHRSYDQISNKTLENKDRSTELKSNFLENSLEEENKPLATGIERTGYSLASFYPLVQSDVQKLQELCGRQFSSRAMNEILLDMSRRLRDRVFKSKKAFMNYMSKVFSHEMRDAVKTNNEGFRIRANMTNDELAGDTQEAFLTKIENSRDTSLGSTLSRKLAGVLEPSVAYALLAAASFPKNSLFTDLNKDDFKISVKRTVELTTGQYDLILSEVKSVYGNHINSLKFELACNPATKNQAASASAIFKGVWGRVRQGLISTCGEAIDRNWFSKLEAVEDQDKNELKLKAPNNFVRDWITQNYQHWIESFCMKENYQLGEVFVWDLFLNQA